MCCAQVKTNGYEILLEQHQTSRRLFVWLVVKKNVQHASSDFIKERPKYGHKQRNWSKAKVHIKFLATVATTSFTGTESCLLPLLQIEESFSICIVRGWHCRERWMVQCSMLQNMGVSRLSLTLTLSRYNQNRIQNDLSGK